MSHVRQATEAFPNVLMLRFSEVPSNVFLLTNVETLKYAQVIQYVEVLLNVLPLRNVEALKYVQIPKNVLPLRNAEALKYVLARHHLGLVVPAGFLSSYNIELNFFQAVPPWDHSMTQHGVLYGDGWWTSRPTS